MVWNTSRVTTSRICERSAAYQGQPGPQPHLPAGRGAARLAAGLALDRAR